MTDKEITEALENLKKTLSPEERLAVLIVKTAIDCYNSKDGTGMFNGMQRYNVLAGRLAIAATQARSPIEFWGLLQKRMLWPPPPQKRDGEIMALLSQPEMPGAIAALAAGANAIVPIARAWHTIEKKQRIADLADTPNETEEENEKREERFFD